MKNIWLECTKHDHTKPFGSRKLGGDMIEDMIDKEEIRINKRRILCTGCNTQKSTSGSCFC